MNEHCQNISNFTQHRKSTMKLKISVLFCLVCVSFGTLSLEAKLRHPRWNDPLMDILPIDPYLYYDDERFHSEINRNHPKTIDINFEDDTAIADTDNALKAIKDLLTYKTAGWLDSTMTDPERHNSFRLDFNQIFQDAYLDYNKIRKLGNIIGNKKFKDLFVKNDVLMPAKNVVALMKETDWTQDEIPEIIQQHIETQQEILKAYMLKYGPTIDALCEKYPDSSGD